METSSLLESLLENNQEESNSVIEDPEVMEFLNNVSSHLLNLWANNDRVVQILCPEGKKDAVKKFVDENEIQNLPEELTEVLQRLKKDITYQDVPGLPTLRVVTLKQVIEFQEIFSVQNWLNDPKVDLYKTLSRKGLVIQPTTQEVRLLILFDALLEARGLINNRVIVPGRTPLAV